MNKSDYDLINLGTCIKGQADRLGIEHEGVPLEGVVVRIAEAALSRAAAPVPGPLRLKFDGGRGAMVDENDTIVGYYPEGLRAAAPEPEWEYRVRTHYVSLESVSDSPWMDEETARSILGWEKGDGLSRALFRRRKAGPVLPVGGESDGD